MARRTEGTVVSDYGYHKEVEISDDRGVALDFPVVPVEQLELVEKHQLEHPALDLVLWAVCLQKTRERGRGVVRSTRWRCRVRNRTLSMGRCTVLGPSR